MTTLRQLSKGCRRRPARFSHFNRNSGGGERKLDFEGAALAKFAGDFDLAVVLVDDAADEREAEARTIAARGVERAEDLRLLLFCHSAAGVTYRDDGAVFVRADFNGYGPEAVDRLDRVEQKIQNHLVNLVAVVFDFAETGILFELDLDGLGEDLLTRQHHGMFDGCVEIAAHHLWRMGASGLEKISENAIDLVDFEANVLDHRAGGAGCRQ